MADAAKLDIAGIVRRGWMIVAIAAVVGAGVAAAATLNTKTTYRGKTYLAVTPLAVSSYAQMPKADVIISRTATPAFAQKVATQLNVPVSQVTGGIKVFTTGNPQDKLWVQFTSADKSLAEKGATAAAKQTLALAQELGDSLISAQRAQVAVDEKTLASLPPASPNDAAAQYYRWNIEKSLAADKGQLAFIESAYSFDAPTAVAASSRRNAILSAAAGGALAGLFLGVVIVAIREWAARRRATSATSA